MDIPYHEKGLTSAIVIKQFLPQALKPARWQSLLRRSVGFFIVLQDRIYKFLQSAKPPFEQPCNVKQTEWIRLKLERLR